MDVLRTAYEANFKFFRDDPERVTKVIWYRVPDNTPALGFPSAFISRNYFFEDWGSPDVGEQEAPRKWRGQLPAQPVGAGGFCGSLEQWQSGALTTDPSPPLYPNTTVPICCSLPDQAIGGTVFGGLERTVFCDDFKNSLPTVLHLQLSAANETDVSCPSLFGITIDLTFDSIQDGWFADLSAISGCGCTVAEFRACTGFDGFGFAWILFIYAAGHRPTNLIGWPNGNAIWAGLEPQILPLDTTDSSTLPLSGFSPSCFVWTGGFVGSEEVTARIFQ